MLTVFFFGFNGVVHFEFLPQVWQRLRKEICKKQTTVMARQLIVDSPLPRPGHHAIFYY